MPFRSSAARVRLIKRQETFRTILRCLPCLRTALSRGLYLCSGLSCKEYKIPSTLTINSPLSQCSSLSCKEDEIPAIHARWIPSCLSVVVVTVAENLCQVGYEAPYMLLPVLLLPSCFICMVLPRLYYVHDSTSIMRCSRPQY
ncbi:unnamed protein product [Leuciscus chuanchicus]